MPFLSNMIVHPVALGRAFLWPFVQVIAGYAALLASLYLLVGLDPSAPAGSFIGDSVDATMPLAGRLAAIWTFYSLFYLLVGVHDRDQCIAGVFLGRAAEAWERRVLLSWAQHAFRFRPGTPPPLLRLLRRGLPNWLATGWRAEDCVQLE